MRYLVVTVVLIATISALGRDLAYLRSIPGIVPIDDVFAYECYVRAFWHGSTALLDAPHMALCGDHRWLFWTAPPRAFHTLPREYPAPALAVFSLPLLWPFAPYGLVYMVLFGLLVFAITAWLVARRLELSATAFGLYVLAGGWATALARFDLAPGVLVLCALVLAERHRYVPAYLLLAAATLLKIYPGFVVLVLATHQWRASGKPPRREMSAFALALCVGLLPGVVLNPGGLLGPLHYNVLRPPQIESVAGSLLWLSGKLGGDVQVRLTYHSVNVLGMLAGAFAWLATLLLVGGLVLVCLRAWHGWDRLGRSFVLVLLVTLCGSKLLSPQYLLWIFPVVAYVEGLRLRWLLVALLTLVIYPNAYALDISLVRLPEHPLFMGSILARNGLLVVLAVYYLWASPLAAASGVTGRAAAAPPGAFGEHRVDASDKHVPREGIAIGGLTTGEG
jgi:hypothetical protein